MAVEEQCLLFKQALKNVEFVTLFANGNKNRP
jgi:hypothetical protein